MRSVAAMKSISRGELRRPLLGNAGESKVRRCKEVDREATGEDEGATSADCTCLLRGPNHPDIIIDRELD